MDKKHVNLIYDNMNTFVEKTRNLERIVEKLAEKKVLNRYMVKYILEHPDHKSRATEFYQMITCRGPNAFLNLSVTLRETQNNEVGDILSSLKVSQVVPPSSSEDKSSLPRAKDDDFDYCKVTNNSAEDEDDSIDYCKVEDLVVKIDPDEKFMDIIEKSPCESQTYKMRSKPRGLALIINIFRAPDPKKNRVGSKLDAEKVIKLFTDIGYKVFPHTDLTKKQMKHEIRAFSMNKELSGVDSLVVFIMCHGRQYKDTEEVELVGTDGSTLRSRWIINQFTDANTNFVPFKKKPKLFFFQACRVVSQEANDVVTDIKNSRDKSPTQQGNIEDTMVVYSTCTGTFSLRDTNEGSWFVNAFCRVVAEHAWQHDLDTMLHSVNKVVLKKRDPTYGTQSMEVKKLGISGKIYFNPGL